MSTESRRLFSADSHCVITSDQVKQNLASGLHDDWDNGMAKHDAMMSGPEFMDGATLELEDFVDLVQQVVQLALEAFAALRCPGCSYRRGNAHFLSLGTGVPLALFLFGHFVLQLLIQPSLISLRAGRSVRRPSRRCRGA